MSGAEHYREAERIEAGVQRFVDLAQSTSDAGNDVASEAAKWAANHLLARAQVHATLALVAVTAETSFDPAGRPLIGNSDGTAAWETVL